MTRTMTEHAFHPVDASRAGPCARRRAARGFTLLEALLAGVILAAALSVILESLSLSSASAGRVLRESAARRIAGDRLHRFSAGEFDPRDASGRIDLDGTTYSWRIDRPRDENGLRRAACDVWWTDRGARVDLSVERLIAPGAGQGGRP